MKFGSFMLSLIGALSIALAAPQPVAQSATRPSYPVSYNFALDVLSNGQRASAPGANQWKCKPSKAHPRPVVLVHGTGGNAATNWGTYSALLANRGYCVFALTYGVVPETTKPVALGGMDRIEVSARQLAAFVTKVRRATRAAKVDLLGHSQGTLMPNYYVRFLGGSKFVKRYVSLAPLWHGVGGDNATLRTPLAVFGDGSMPICKACNQMGAGSAFMTKMRSGRLAHPDVTYTNIVTKYDEVVVPYTSGIQTGYRNMRNIVLQDRCANDFSDHLQIAASANGAQLVLNALDPAHARAITCRPTLPVGTLG